MKFLIYVCFAISIIPQSLYSQNEIKFGEVSPKEFKIPAFVADSSVAAVVLYDHGTTTYNHEFKIILTVHERVLLLDDSEFDRATLKVRYYKGGHVTNIKAASYNLVNGKVVEEKMSRKDIFNEDVAEDVYAKRFTIPGVRKGSIIEYTYTVASTNYYNLNTWYFQQNVPVQYSQYRIVMPGFFNYRQNLKGIWPLSDYQVETKFGNFQGLSFTDVVKTFEAKNVPAFKEESFISDASNYITQIRFDLIDYTWPNSVTKVVNPSSYEELSDKLMDNLFYSDIYSRNGFLDEVLEQIVDESMTDLEKAQIIYNFVQNTYSIDNDNVYDNIRKIHKEKKGSAFDINSVLTSYMIRAGLQAYLVLVTDKENGKLNLFYPTRRNFNKAITLVKIEGKDYLLDATNPYLTFNLLSPATINDKGLVVSSELKGLIDVDYNDYYTKKASVMANVLTDGSMDVEINSKRSGYAVYSLLARNEGDLSIYKEDFEKDHPLWDIETFEVEQEDYEVAENLQFNVESVLGGEMADMIVFNPVIYNQVKENPFKEEERLLPVTLNRPVNYLTSCNIQIPEGYKVDVLPEPLMLALPNNAGYFRYSCSEIGGKITVMSILKISETEYTSEEFYLLKEFYTKIVEKHNQEVVIKKVSENE